MGLQTWKGSVVRKVDISVAKNYLDQDELSTLNLVTTQFLDFAELRARRRQSMTMVDWTKQTDRFLELNDMPVLAGKGRVSRELMTTVSAPVYEQYDKGRRELELLRAEQEAQDELGAAVSEQVGDDITALEDVEGDEPGRRS